MTESDFSRAAWDRCGGPAGRSAFLILTRRRYEDQMILHAAKSATVRMLIALGVAAWAAIATAQVVLPDVTVKGSGKDESHGGYVISGDFQVDTHMSSVIYPTEALNAGDILSVQPLRMADDEYLVLQECISSDCTHAQILRVWGAFGATTEFHDPNRIFVPHDGKYFLWMAQIKAGPAPPEAGVWFTEFQKYGAPLMLSPIGRLAAYSETQIAAAQSAGPVHVKVSQREGASFFATFATGAIARIKRMHAAESDASAPTDAAK